MADYMIGDLARRAACNVRTIRYYEDIGVMPTVPRGKNGRRCYDEEHLHRLNFIRHSRELGFSLEEIREILSLSDTPEKPCAEIDDIAGRKLKEIESRIERLNLLRLEFKHILAQCQGGKIADCRIVRVLANHDLCVKHGNPKRR